MWMLFLVVCLFGSRNVNDWCGNSCGDPVGFIRVVWHVDNYNLVRTAITLNCV
jgi:hypothetical protein